MNTRRPEASLLLLLFIAFTLLSSETAFWGFFAHKRINKMAVFTLPAEMYPLFKKQIEYLSEHAVDPDKRRYADPLEGIRHYIDLDVYEDLPPRQWEDAVARYSVLLWKCGERTDSLIPYKTHLYSGDLGTAGKLLDSARWRKFIGAQLSPLLTGGREGMQAAGLMLDGRDSSCVLEAASPFTKHGILPWHLYRMQKRLTHAFKTGEADLILKYAADIGHYIGDAHVPLHTTENYNGQLSGQHGIHAFWESRIPELFADERWDFLCGKARYIEDPQRFFWDIVLESHSKVDSVLALERKLSSETPLQQRYCFEKRNVTIVKTQCADYAEAYDSAMQGMVERRMRKAIHAVGSSWYTAWVDAGRPDLQMIADGISPSDSTKMEVDHPLGEKVLGRPH